MTAFPIERKLIAFVLPVVNASVIAVPMRSKACVPMFWSSVRCERNSLRC
jgi:hypothetical protein